MRQWGIHYGVLADKIAIQLTAQGLPMPLSMCDRWEKMRDAINLLRLSGIMSDSESDKILKKLHKNVERAVKKKYEQQ